MNVTLIGPPPKRCPRPRDFQPQPPTSVFSYPMGHYGCVVSFDMCPALLRTGHRLVRRLMESNLSVQYELYSFSLLSLQSFAGSRGSCNHLIRLLATTIRALCTEVEFEERLTGVASYTT